MSRLSKCSCGNKAVLDNYCKEHFILHIENTVKKTIKRFKLIKKDEKIAVAISGGKDSQTTLYLLHKWYGDNVEGICIDEGIKGYRDSTILDLKEFCEMYDIKYKVYSFKEAFGKDLDAYISENKPACRTCGVLRRHLLNIKSFGYDKIATGHNLDDECQSIIMNFLKGNNFLSAKLGPISGIKEREGFTQRIKPLYLCSEREIAAYTFVMGFPVKFNECPYSRETFRSKIRDELNEIENERSGTKRTIINNFLKILPKLKSIYVKAPSPLKCKTCGSPSTNQICMACKTVGVK